MVNKNLEMESLEALAERIVKCATEADERTIEAALLVREARNRVDRGEAGDTTWYEWAPKNIGLSTTRLWELQRIADADDHQKELKRLRERARERAKEHRQKKKEAVLCTGSEMTVKVPAEGVESRQTPSETGLEVGLSQHVQRTVAPPLRNGGEDDKSDITDESDQRNRLANWARSAPIEHVRHVLSVIRSFGSANSSSNSDQADGAIAA